MQFPCSDALSYAQVCEGKLDVVFQCSNKIWDIHPLIPIIKASGGIVSTIDNRDAIKLATYSALSCWLNRMHQSVAEEEKTSMLESVNMTLDFLINIDKNIKNMEIEMKNMKDNKKKAYDMLERLVKKDVACEVKKTRRGRKKIAEPLKDEN